MHRSNPTLTTRLPLMAVLASAVLLAACGGGGGSSNAAAPGGLEPPQSQGNGASQNHFELTVTTQGAGTVTSSPRGITCSAATSPCSASYKSDTSVSLSAIPSTGYTFTGWSGDACSGAASTCDITVSEATAVTAIFTAIPYTLTVTKTGSGTVTSAPSGINCDTTATSCNADFTSGTSVTLTATPATGYTFTGWTGACAGATANCTLPAITSAVGVAATFVPTTYTLTLSKTGSGTVTSSPSGISCGASCSASYTSGTSVTLSAVPASGYTFTSWSGACAGAAASCTIPVTSAVGVSATFTVIPPVSYSLALTKTGAGTVTSSPSGISCGTTCNASYVSGTSVTLSAVATSGNTFSGWAGACSGSAPSCTIPITSAAGVTATFAPITYSLTLTKTGSGTVTSSPSGISCGTSTTSCNASYASGTSVTLSAAATSGNTFSGWAGACSGSASSCTVQITSAASVTATFVPLTYSLTVTNQGAGTVTSSPSGINCATTVCSANYNSGTSVTLSAAPSSGYTFTSWGGACSGTASTCTVAMSSARGVTANYTANAAAAITLIQDTRTLDIFNKGIYPTKGVVQTDPITSFKVTRVSDKTELVGDYMNHVSPISSIVYSRYTPSNTTGEFVVIHGDNSTSAWVYRTSDNKMMTVLKIRPASTNKAATNSLGEVNELRWDYSGAHPYRLYFVGRAIPRSQAVGTENPGMSFYYTDINPSTGAQSTPVVIRDFSSAFSNYTGTEIMNDVEGDSSNDSRYWAWQVMDTSITSGTYKPVAIFSYDAQTNTVMGSLQRSCATAKVGCTVINTPAATAPYITRPNMVEMSPSGVRTLVHWERAYAGSNAANINTTADGPKAFLPNYTDPIRIGADATHSGWAWGPNGEEMYVSQNNRNDWIEAVDIASAATAKCTLISDNSYTCGTKIYPYTALDGGSWSVGMHFGKVYNKAKKGWVFMNTYDTTNSVWAKNQNLLIEI
ncbi:MAG: InlB B-repeat-containing protein, partial [Aquabacterium sp.]|nr:InlB B-repeat-containing protein [Aquabacterium sp.]